MIVSGCKGSERTDLSFWTALRARRVEDETDLAEDLMVVREASVLFFWLASCFNEGEGD